MAVSGLPTKCHTHAHQIAKMALDMLDAANSITIGGQPFRVIIRECLRGWTFFLVEVLPYLTLNIFIVYFPYESNNTRAQCITLRLIL